MSTKPKNDLDMFRLDGGTPSIGCRTCPLLSDCGGYARRGGGWSCMDRCDSCDQKCDLVCFKRPDFARAFLEVGGFAHRSIPTLVAPADAMPRYIPVMQHPVDKAVPLDWVALPLPSVMRFEGSQYGPRSPTADELRATFGLPSTTKIVLVGVGKDRGIETYWREHRKQQVARALEPLRWSAAIVPNYSLFLEEPRTQHMFNRKRSLLVAKDLSESGIPTALFLQAVSSGDWAYWESFLRAHPEVTHVAKEFQTGTANPTRGAYALDGVSRLQERLGRRLHLFAIGAARYRCELPQRFDSWTILDSTPFMKAVNRRVAAPPGRRIRWQPARGEDVSNLLLQNVGHYIDWIEQHRPVHG
jgi:hypothetical protein